MSKNESNVIARHEGSVAGEAEIDIKIAELWKQRVSEGSGELARLFGASADALDPNRPPFCASVSGSGITGSEIEIMFVSGFVLELAKSMGEAAGKALLKKLKEFWRSDMEEDLTNPRDGVLGPMIDDEDED